MNARIVLRMSSVAVSLALAACATSRATDVPIEWSTTPVLDVSPSQRVLVAGFLAGGITDIDTNAETVRLLRSQLRSKTTLHVIDNADALTLSEIAAERPPGGAHRQSAPASTKADARQRITTEAALRPYESVFANTAYWRRLGEEYSGPLIVTGTVFLAIQTAPVLVRPNREQVDPFGRRGATAQGASRAPRTVCTLHVKFVFIDGRTGALLYTADSRQSISHETQATIAALSSYFELMDRVLPAFLRTVSPQIVREMRTLLR